MVHFFQLLSLFTDHKQIDTPATPILLLTSERLLKWHFFDPSRGSTGISLLWLVFIFFTFGNPFPPFPTWDLGTDGPLVSRSTLSTWLCNEQTDGGFYERKPQSLLLSTWVDTWTKHCLDWGAILHPLAIHPESGKPKKKIFPQIPHFIFFRFLLLMHFYHMYHISTSINPTMYLKMLKQQIKFSFL